MIVETGSAVSVPVAYYALVVLLSVVGLSFLVWCAQCTQQAVAVVEDPDALPPGFPGFPEASKGILRKPSTIFPVDESVIVPKPGDPEPEQPGSGSGSTIGIDRESSSMGLESDVGSSTDLYRGRRGSSADPTIQELLVGTK